MYQYSIVSFLTYENKINYKNGFAYDHTYHILKYLNKIFPTM